MGWKGKINKKLLKRHDGNNKNTSLSNKLKQENKITEEFEIMLASLTLEEIIALKLELASKAVNGHLYGLPLWGSLPNIAKDAILKYLTSACKSQADVARALGINKIRLNEIYKKFRVKDYFNNFEDF
tara:strand:+ start:3691 stop:4074 length:384 start_codon:yes stop_codon:yes gene_type:complete